MTEVMTMATGGGVNLSTYTYTSEPRIVQSHRKSARGVMPARLIGSSGGNGNPMYDRRVVRGSNYAKRIDGDDLPKWNPYFSNARSLTQGEQQDPTNLSQSQHLRRQEFRQKLETRARLRRESHGVSSLYASHNSGANNLYRNYARAHVHVQTENYYEPLERPPASDAGAQTDPWSDEGGFVAPVVAPTVPGVDVSTQVFNGELDVDTDDDALVAALVGRTIREAVMEVIREEHAEESRNNILATESLSSFHKSEEPSGDQDKKEEEKEPEDKSTAEEREEPEGKETTPEGTVEAPRSPDVRSPAPSEVTKDIDITEGQEHETLVN